MRIAQKIKKYLLNQNGITVDDWDVVHCLEIDSNPTLPEDFTSSKLKCSIDAVREADPLEAAIAGA
jgi:hypothetical protein